MARGGKRDGAGRPKGKSNAATTEAREVFNTFLLSNIDKLQSLFDKVAEENPQKAIELLFKASEYVVPKLKSLELIKSTESEEQKIQIVRIVKTQEQPPLVNSEREIVE